MRRVIIAGSRHFDDRNTTLILIHAALRELDIDDLEVVTGGASGVDAAGAHVAAVDRCAHTVFPADWDTHGRAAGPIRNRQMAEYAAVEPGGALILIWDGKSRGSASMLKEARRAGLRIVQVVIEE